MEKEKNKTKRIALYCRVSTADQNPENQELELVRFAEAMGWDYKVFKEKKSTRKTRPIKDKIFKEALQKKWDGIVVWKLDRWARSTTELVRELDALREKEIEFHSLQESISLDDSPVNRFFITVLSAFAQLERDIISERTKLGLQRAKVNGAKLGRPKGSKDKKKRRKSGYYKRWTEE